MIALLLFLLLLQFTWSVWQSSKLWTAATSILQKKHNYNVPQGEDRETENLTV
jgi:hypothetical protein